MMIGLSLAVTSAGVSGSQSLAAEKIAAESAGMSVNFLDMSLLIKDTVTPANNFNGNANSKLTNGGTPTKWVRNSSGVWTSGTDLRTAYSSSSAALGLYSETAATNLFVSPRAPATQGVSVTAQAYTLSFDGTGTITLSGASTAGPLVGTGANDRVSLTFTPSVGTLTLTVSGTMDFVQLETGTISTTFTETTRTQDNVTLATSLFQIDPGAAHTVVCSFNSLAANAPANQNIITLNDNSANNRTTFFESTGGLIGQRVTSAGSSTVSASSASGVGTGGIIAARIAPNDYALYYNGAQITTDATVTMPASYTKLSFGVAETSGGQLNNTIKWAVVLPRGMDNTELTAISTP
jgi:hypothetical protein